MYDLDLETYILTFDLELFSELNWWLDIEKIWISSFPLNSLLMSHVFMNTVRSILLKKGKKTEQKLMDRCRQTLIRIWIIIRTILLFQCKIVFWLLISQEKVIQYTTCCYKCRWLWKMKYKSNKWGCMVIKVD